MTPEVSSDCSAIQGTRSLRRSQIEGERRGCCCLAHRQHHGCCFLLSYLMPRMSPRQKRGMKTVECIHAHGRREFDICKQAAGMSESKATYQPRSKTFKKNASRVRNNIYRSHIVVSVVSPCSDRLYNRRPGATSTVARGQQPSCSTACPTARGLTRRANRAKHGCRECD